MVLIYVRALALICVGLAALVWLIPAAPMTGDGHHYIEFVRNNLQHGASSLHDRRLLGPLIVRAMPLDALDGFFVLTVSSLGLTGLLTWLAARVVLADEARALAAIPLLFGTWVVAPNLREFALVDPLAWVFVAAVWLAILRQHWWLAAALAAVGVLAKEVVVLAALAAAAAAWSPRRPWLAVGVVAPALLVVLLLTQLRPGSGADTGAYVLKWVRDGLGSLGIPRVLFLVFAAYGALWLLLPRGWQALTDNRPYVRRAATVLFLAALLLPFVGSPERMEEAIFPLMVSAALVATSAWSLPLVWVLAVCNVLFVARVGGDARLPSVVAWSALAVACGVSAWSYVRPRLSLRAGAPLPGTTARLR